MTNAELETKLKLLGFSSATLSVAQWAEICAQAVRLYSHHRPRLVLSTMTTTANVEEYNLPSGGKVIISLAPYQGIRGAIGTYFESWQISEAASGAEFTLNFNQPSQIVIFRQKLKDWNAEFGTHFTQHHPGGSYRIIPRPTSAKELAILYTADHANAETVPDTDEELLILAGKVAANEILAETASVSAIGSARDMRLGAYAVRGGAFVSMAKQLADRAKEQRDELDARARLGAFSIVE